MARPSLWQNKTRTTFRTTHDWPMLRPTLSFLVITLAGVCMLMSCNDARSTAYNAENTNDSTALRIALLPIEECAPLRYAMETGMAKRMGLNMILIEYDAMMDMDTAVMSDMAHVYFEDSTRMGRIKSDSLRPTILLPIPVKMSLVTNKQKEIDKLASLKTHMVGLTRLSALEHWMSVLTDTAHLEQDEIYHAQINSIPLRFRMLNDGLIDAAIMPRPWSDSLATLGHSVIENQILDGMGFFISARAMADSTRLRQARLLKEIYLKAMTHTQE